MKSKARKLPLLPTLMGLAVVAVTVAAQLGWLPLLKQVNERLEWMIVDERLRYSVPETPIQDPRIVIVDIDEKSLKEEGRWPWSRTKVADLVEKLFDYGVGVVGFDVVFAEPQLGLEEQLNSEALGALSPEARQALKELHRHFDHDSRLADAIAGKAVVLGYTFTLQEQDAKGGMPEPVYPMMRVPPDAISVRDMRGYIGNLEILQEAAASAGFFNVTPDADGVIRRAPVLVRYGQDLYESLALAMVRQATQIELLELHVDPVKSGDTYLVESVSLDGEFEFFTDNAGQVIIPYRGRAGSFPYISASDILHNRVAPGVLENTLVLVGTTAKGLYDLRSTPVQSVYPGVEIHANLIAGIVDQTLGFEPSWAVEGNLAVTLGLGLFATLLFSLLGPVGVIVAGAVMVGAIAGGTTWLWWKEGMQFAMAMPSLMVTLIAFINVTYGFVSESKSKRQLKAVFGQYVPPERVEAMSKDPTGDFGMEGESRDMSVLFCDIRGFTTISESLAADELKQLLNQFFTPMTAIIFNGQGTIDKYVGDMIMAFWGAPLEDKQHRRHAVDAALKMLTAAAQLRDEFVKRDWPAVEIGVGINSGMMNVGDMGSEYRRSYTVIGDAVNLGSRLEGLTKFYGVQLIISETACEGLDHLVLRRLDRVKVKGKHEPVSIFEPLCQRDEARNTLLAEVEDYHQALSAYFEGDWEAAAEKFQQLAQRDPESKLYRLYCERITTLVESGLGGVAWDGVFTHTSK